MYFSAAGSPGRRAPRLLDTFPAMVAYSTSRLSTDYSGPCLRVRSELDDSELDIDFAGEWLSALQLINFIGPVYIGRIAAWYDQSGNGRDAVQPTKALQPQICIGGVVDTNGGRPAILFNGTGRNLRYGSPISCTSASSFAVFEETSNSTSYAAWSSNPSKGELWRFGSGAGFMSNLSALRREGFPSSGVSGRSLVETYHSATNAMTVFKNGTSLGTDTTQAFEAPTEIKIGASEFFQL